MTKQAVENWLVSKKGYIKKHPFKTLQAMWKASGKHVAPKTKTELEKELKVIKEVQSVLRKAKAIQGEESSSELMDLYNKVIQAKNQKPIFTYVDIEVSPNLCLSWRVGQKINLTHDNIVKERSIITICWKNSNEDKVNSLVWKSGDDKEMLQKFAKVLNNSQVICGHNLRQFDLKWIKGRCLYHNIELNNSFNIIDTLTMSRSNFNLNSHRLDYLSKYLGKSGKEETSYELWKSVFLNNDKKALNTLVEYCKNDVKILQEVHEKIEKYTTPKKWKLKI